MAVICEDIDYQQRHALGQPLGQAASQAVGWPVGILLTGWPEWRRRVKLISSFEYKIDSESITLVERPLRPGQINDNKPIGSPLTNVEEAWNRLGDACESLVQIRQILASDNTNYSTDNVRGQKLRSLALVRAASDLIETSLKSLLHATGGNWPEKSAGPAEPV